MPSCAQPKELAVVLASLDDDKAIDVVAIDISGRSTIADWMVIASGTSSRHVAAMAGHIVEKLKAIGLKPRDEGLPQADWVAVDGGDVVAHLFRPEVRSFYDLEGMWKLPEPKAAPKAAKPAKEQEVPAKKPVAPKKAAAPAKKPAAKKPTPAKKPAAPKKAAAPAKKPAAPAKRAAPVKKPAAAKKPTPAKKAAPKPSAAKKPTAKKAAPAKKPAVKKPVAAKKPAAKKPAPKKKG